jgi:cysteine desulfurase family protein (TIGR01976 family)
MAIDIEAVRSRFPALESDAIFFDGPGGTQVSQRVIDRMRDYLVNTNANHGGAYATSEASDAVVDEARRAMMDFYNARREEEIVFGPNMTSLTLRVSRALAKELGPGDEIVVTRLDHDANISPWLLVARDRGCQVRWVDIDVEDCTLRMDQMRAAIRSETRIVAVGYASNGSGTINPVHEVVEMAHDAGALCYIDAVQYAPHLPIDVQQLDADFLVSSAYKFFGPHAGILYGKYELLEGLEAYKVRPAPKEPPGKFETGTGNFEAIAGVLGAMEYLEWLGQSMGAETGPEAGAEYSARALNLRRAMAAIQAYENEISLQLLDVLEGTPGLRLYGIAERDQLQQRVPTFVFTLSGFHPREVARFLGARGIYVWDGHYYALSLAERLGLAESGGMVRVGLVHYNTQDEVERLGEALQDLVGGNSAG